MERNKAPDVHSKKVMVFGAVFSPSVAQFVKNINAALFEHNILGILRAVERQHYVDD